MALERSGRKDKEEKAEKPGVSVRVCVILPFTPSLCADQILKHLRYSLKKWSLEMQVSHVNQKTAQEGRW